MHSLRISVSHLILGLAFLALCTGMMPLKAEAAVAYRSHTIDRGTAANFTASEPSGAAQNDILVAIVYIESDTTVTPPTGWSNSFNGTTMVAELDCCGQEFKAYTYWIRRGSSAPDLTWTFSSAFREVAVIAYSGADTTGDPFSFGAVAERDTSASSVVPDISGTTAEASELLIWFGANYMGGSWTGATGFTTRYSVDGNDTVNADKIQASAGSTGTVTGGGWTGGGGNGTAAAFLMGLKPVSTTPELIGYWNFDEGTGTTANDTSGNDYDGTLTNGPTWTTGYLNGGLSFDGSDDFVQVTGLLGSPTAVTISAWVNLTAPDTIAAEVVSIGDAAALRADEDEGDGVGGFYHEAAAWNSTRSTDFIAGTGWHHIVYVTDPANSRQEVYIDGVSQVTTTDPDAISYSGVGTNTFIGTHGNGGTDYSFNGIIDEVRVYSGGMSDTEVGTLYDSYFTGNSGCGGCEGRAMPNGLVGYWSFNDATSTHATDFSWRGNTGTLTNGPAWVSGKFGSALDFDGGNDYVDAGSAGSLNITGAFTLTSWIYWEGAGTGAYETIMSKESGGADGYDLWFGNSTTNVVGCGVNAGANEINSGTALRAGQWYHIACVHTGSGLEVYVDGALANSGGSGTAPAANSAPFRVGKSNSGGDYFEGKIDEARVYNRALSPTEIAKIYNLSQAVSKPPNKLGLVGYWSFNEGSGTLAGDFSAFGNTGTLISSPVWVSGKRGSALSFSASNYVITATETSIPSQAITISAWINPNDIITTKNGIMIVEDRDGPVGGEDDCVSFSLYIQGSGLGTQGVLGQANNTSCSSWGTAASTLVLSTDTWQHVVYTQDSSENYAFYVNGVVAGTGTNTQPITDYAGNGNTVTIGTSKDIGAFGNDQFDGEIDEVRIYNRALSAAEVAKLYGSGAVKLAASSKTLTQGSSLERGLVGLWSFDGSSTLWSSATAGTTLDGSGNSKTGTLSNMNRNSTPKPGKLGQALDFDGANDSVTISDTFDPTAYTISAWVKPTDVTSVGIFTRTDSGGPTLNFSHNIRITSGSVFQHYAFDGAANTVTGTTIVQSNTWYYVVAVAENGGNMRLYVNGVEEGTPEGISTLWTAGDRYYIGQPDGDVAGWFAGAIDEVRLYDRALSTTEIKQLYNLGKIKITQ